MPRWGAVLGILVGLLLALGLDGLGVAAPAADVEQPAARYRGPVTYYGRPATVGALVSVHLGQKVVASGPVFVLDGVPSYDLVVLGDDPATPEPEGPAENDSLSFRVNGVPADQVETFNDMEDRLLPLAVTRVTICLGAYEDLDRDLAHDPGEPWLDGVVINVQRFRTDLIYRTTGEGEPACFPFVAEPKEVRAVDWPADFDPPSGQGQPAVRIEQTEGLFVVAFPFVRLGSAAPTPGITNTPATPTPTPEVFPGPTGLPPLPTATPEGPPGPSPSPEPGPPTAEPGPSPSPVPTRVAPGGSGVLTVNSSADPGVVGDGELSLREALLLATGELAPEDLSAAERAQIAGPTGANASDLIRFDPGVFPPGGEQVIYLRPPVAGGPEGTRWVSGFTVCQPIFWGPPEPGLPPLSTGYDQIDATGAGVTLSGDLAGGLVDGIVITSDDNAVRGLRLTGFKAGLLLSGSARNNILGGVEPGQGLSIGGSIAGIVLHGAGVEGNHILGNRIGLAADGSTAQGNATHGILVAGGAVDNQVGAPGAGNLIGDNFANGVAVVGGGTRRNRLQANRIGTTAGGDVARPNGLGVGIGCGATDTLVGGAAPGEGNLISGNGAEGLWIQAPETRGTLIQGNRIGVAADGVTPLPNHGDGILISDGARQSQIGGDAAGMGNVIARNLGAGLRLSGTATTGHTIRRNRITANAAGGIALVDGANGGLVAPLLTLVEGDIAEGLAPPLSLVEVYSDPSDEGAWFEGTVEADELGWFRLKSGRVFRGPRVNALAVDRLGNTSPFGSEGELPTPTATTGTPETTPEASPSAPTPTPAAGRQLFLPYITQDHILFASLALEPAASVLPMGGLITLDLRLSGARDLFGMQIVLDYPPDLLEVIDADPGTVGLQILPGDFPDPGRIFIAENWANNSTGRIHYAFSLMEKPSVNGEGVVARIRFRGRGPGPAAVTFREKMLSDPNAVNLPVQGLGAVLTILPPPSVTPGPTPTSGPPPTAPPAPTNTPAPTHTAAPTNTVAPTNTAVPTNTVAPTNTATQTLSPPPTVVPPPSATATASPAPTDTAVPSATASPSATLPASATPEATATPEASVTASPTPEHTASPSAEPTVSATPSATVLPSDTPEATVTSTPEGTPTVPATPEHTATSSPTPSATPTASAIPPPTADPCTRPLRNPGFETDEAWTLAGGRPPRYTVAMAHSGRQSLFLGLAPNEPNVYSFSTTWQPVVVPTGAGTMTVSAWTFQAAEAGGGPDRQLLLVYDIDPAQNLGQGRAPIGIVFAERTNAQTWQRRALTLDVRGWRGRTLWVYSSVANDGFGGRAYMVLDDMEVAFCP